MTTKSDIKFFIESLEQGRTSRLTKRRAFAAIGLLLDESADSAKKLKRDFSQKTISKKIDYSDRELSLIVDSLKVHQFKHYVNNGKIFFTSIQFFIQNLICSKINWCTNKDLIKVLKELAECIANALGGEIGQILAMILLAFKTMTQRELVAMMDELCNC